MINRLLSFLQSLPSALWRNTVGRLMGSAAPAEPARRTPIIQSSEPRSVAGITLRASLVVLAVAFAAYLVYELRLLLILVFLAVLLAAGMYGVVRIFERFLPRIPAVVTSYLLLIGAFALTIFLIFPPLIRQAVELVEDLPRIADDLRTGAIDLIDGIAGAGAGEEMIDTLTAGTGDGLPEFGSLLSVPLTAASIVANLVIVIFLSALISIERDRARDYLMNFVEEPDREAVLQSGRKVLLKLGAYVRGQLLVMTIIGVGTFIGLVVVGMFVSGKPIPFAVPLAALSFVTAAIPMAGAFIAGAAIVLVSLTVSPLAALLMAAWMTVLQQLEGSVITPYVQGKVVNLSAVVVLLAVVAGTTLAGIVGGIIAIPVVAVADVVIRDFVFPLRRRAEDRRNLAPIET